ncbi:CDP-glycerol glycerophosphotransferase family protein [Leuconostoc falkenbergense]|uniref:CDP-glycerol glycerophosphotransferase family protein n=1 Tax=Leuconostoc falkenbergense TaxID=2766470 RepID=UPI0024A8D549|nr:CDP-glycerol glycerophosphotransferase family protein [Leuconostoc falkenbergense]MDI6552899.1 CDP-glycerol glycerophosphotransferase family protein [Leuconostoc falkenbergense]
MNKIVYKTFKQINKSMGKLVRETNNFKLISRMYATKYSKIKVRNDSFFYETRDGQNFSDSPLQIMKFLLARYPDFNHYIVYQNRYFEEVTLGLHINKIDYAQNPKIHLVERNTPEYVEAILFSKFLITDSTFQSFFVKKNDQIYLNTWHGTPLKTMGYAMPDGNFDSWNVLRNFLMTDYLVSPNRHTTEIFLKDYRLQDKYDGKILEIGYPRNDSLSSGQTTTHLRHFLEEQYAFSKNKLTLVYAPTWSPSDMYTKPSKVADTYINMYRQLNTALGDQYNILMKVHPFVYNRIKRIESIKKFVVNDGIDANELLAEADILVTDFSSIFFDFLNTNKPIVFFNEDAETYKKERGYYFPLESLPGPFFSKSADLIEYIKKGDFNEYSENYSIFKKKFVSLDDGKVTDKVVDLMLNGRFEKYSDNIITANKNEKKTALIYTGGMQNNGISAALINLVNHIDYTNYDVSLLTADNRNDDAFFNNFNKITDKVRVFVIRGESSYGWIKLFGKFFAENFAIFRFLYSQKQAKLNARRLLANQKFDIAIDFDSYVMNNGQWIAASEAEHTYNVLHNDMWLEANKKVDGRLKNSKTKKYLHFWNLFDTSLSVSEATRKINDIKLKKYINKSGVLTNIIDAEKIIQLSKKNVVYESLNIENLLEHVDKKNSSEITKATFGDVDISKRALSIHNSGSYKKATKFITNSRLSPEKNIDNLILAFVKLHSVYPSVELHIFGKDVGNYAPVLYDLVLSNQAENYIKFYGYSENPFPAIANADVFLLPSHTEGQSVALMEAMVLQKNIVASNILANIELLNGGDYGLLTIGNHPDQLLESLKIMADGKYKRLKNFDSQSHNKLVLHQFDKLFE